MSANKNSVNKFGDLILSACMSFLPVTMIVKIAKAITEIEVTTIASTPKAFSEDA